MPLNRNKPYGTIHSETVPNAVFWQGGKMYDNNENLLDDKGDIVAEATDETTPTESGPSRADELEQLQWQAVKAITLEMGLEWVNKAQAIEEIIAMEQLESETSPEPPAAA